MDFKLNLLIQKKINNLFGDIVGWKAFGCDSKSCLIPEKKIVESCKVVTT